MWQSETCSNYRDFLTRTVQLATSKYVSAATVNAGGTGYTVGDLLTIPHAGGTMLATVEVLTAPAGVVTTVKLRNFGAYSNRVATVTVNAGGSAYPVSTTVLLAISGGTATCPAKVSATTNGSGVVTAVSVFEGGGAYSAAPAGTGAATTRVGPSTATTGSGCTVNTTMTGLVGTSGVATTGGTGTGCTLNLTLTDAGWSVQRDRNDYSFNSLNDEKEVILLGTAAGGDAPYLGFRTYSIVSGVDTNYGVLCNGFDTFNAGLSYDAQSNPGPAVTVPSANGCCAFLLLGALSAAPTTFLTWWSITPRKIAAVARLQKGAPVTNTCYVSCYWGLLNPFGTASENPYPMAVFGTTWVPSRSPFSGGLFVTGITEAITDVGAGANRSPCQYRRASDGAWVQVANIADNGVGLGTYATGQTVYPVGSPPDPSSTPSADQIHAAVTAGISATYFRGGIVQPQFGAQLNLFPSLGDNQTVLIPATIVSAGSNLNGDPGANTIDHTVRGELDNVFWVSATKSDGSALNSEDTITVGANRYRVFQNVERTQRYSYFAMLEA